jgi:hypothetical protein
MQSAVVHLAERGIRTQARMHALYFVRLAAALPPFFQGRAFQSEPTKRRHADGERGLKRMCLNCVFAPPPPRLCLLSARAGLFTCSQ